MHRLFWKIFLSFWGALILFAVTTIIAASGFIDRMRAQQDGPNPHASLMNYVAEAQSVADRGDTTALRHWLEGLDRREAIPLLLLDANGEDLLGRAVPALITERFNRWWRRSPSSGRRSTRPRPVIELRDGSEYRLVPDFQNVTLGRVLRRPRVIALPLFVAAAVSGLVCFFLARYLTAPLVRLRFATEQVAAGDLGYRVATLLGRRKDEIADLAVAFDRMAERLEALVSTQKQLLRDVSHELRSPLSRLQVALGLARQRSGGRAEGELDRIELETERLNDLIGQLLSLARLESGNEAITQEPVDLADLLDTVTKDAAFEAQTRNRNVDLVRTVPSIVTADARLLHQALENVVRNAIKYTAEGTTVEVSMDRDREHPRAFLIRVRDHGPGVPEEMLTRLFEPFVRVGDARDRASGGYGLGLAIAERSLRTQGGHMSARNEPDGGLSLIIRVPENGGETHD